MERGRMLKEPDNQSSGKAAAKIDSKTSAAALHSYRAMKTPMIMILTHHIIFPSSRTLNALLAYARARRASSAVENYDYLLSPSIMPCFQDDFSQMPKFR